MTASDPTPGHDYPPPGHDHPPASFPRAPATAADAGPHPGLVCGLIFLAGLAVLGWGIYLAARHANWALLPAGILTVAGATLAWPVASALARAAASSERHAAHARLHADAAAALLRRLAGSVAVVERNSGLSDTAKRVAYRDEDRDAVRRAVEEDLRRGDFAGAHAMIDEMEQNLGYKEEALRLRQTLADSKNRRRDDELADLRAHVDRLCAEERWADAFRDADAAVDRFGGDMPVKLLRTRVEEKRQTRKIELLKTYHDAVGRRDVDAATDLLRRLDAYLTPDEGRQLAESAREVFKSKLLSLKEDFTRAMQKHDYYEALRLGGVIRRDFPNSQLAKEVGDHEPRLRELAGIAPEEPATA